MAILQLAHKFFHSCFYLLQFRAHIDNFTLPHQQRHDEARKDRRRKENTAEMAGKTQYLSRSEAAEKIGVTTRTVDRMVADGTLNSRLFRGRRKIQLVSITKFIRSRDK